MVKIHQISAATNTVSPLNSFQGSPSAYYKPSTLEKFAIDFEYDKTLQEIKRDVRMRTHKA